MIKPIKNNTPQFREIPVQRSWDDTNGEQPTEQWVRKNKKFRTLLDKIVNKLSK